MLQSPSLRTNLATKAVVFRSRRLTFLDRLSERDVGSVASQLDQLDPVDGDGERSQVKQVEPGTLSVRWEAGEDTLDRVDVPGGQGWGRHA